MTRFDAQRLADVQAAIDAIRGHLARGDLTGCLIFGQSAMALTITSPTLGTGETK